MKYNTVTNNYKAIVIRSPTEFIDCDCNVVNETNNPIWVRFTNSTIKAKTNHPFMMEYFANCEHRFNIQILPKK